MVTYAALSMLVCCIYLQHTGALELIYNPSEGEDGGPQEVGELLGAFEERQNGRQKRTGFKRFNCDLDWKGNSLPIIVSEVNHKIISPETSNNKEIIRIETDKQNRGVIISCGRKRFADGRLPRHNVQVRHSIAAVRAYCNPNSKLIEVDGIRYDPLAKLIQPIPPRGSKILDATDISFISCKEQVQHTLIETTEKCDGGRKYYIASFDKIKNEFVKQITTCFDKSLETTLWTQHTLHGAKIGIVESGNPSETWRDDFDFDMEMTYLKINKKDDNNNKKLEKLSDKLKRDVIAPQKFIARGHLSPDADFLNSLFERSATYYYINTLPQWQADNNGNWKNIVEASVRKLANVLKTDLTIVSGGHGILKLKPNTGPDVKIYLKEKPDKVPVPEVMWKVVYNPKTKEGIAFVTSNDPFIGQLDANKLSLSPTTTITPLCTDVCDKLDTSWFKATAPHNYQKGYTYCCRVDELRKQITTIPEEFKNIKKLLGAISTGK